MLELLTRPLIIVFRFGIEVDDALREGSSGFPGESDVGEADEGSVLNGISFWPWGLIRLYIKNYELNLETNLKVASHT